MNDLFFYCRTCRAFTEAGYRWCYSTLEEPAIVQRSKRVDVDRVLSVDAFWKGASEGEWLARVLGQVRTFLTAHRAHDLRFGTRDDFSDATEDNPQGSWRQEPPIDPAVKLQLAMRRPFPTRPATVQVSPPRDASIRVRVRWALFNGWERAKVFVRRWLV